MKQVRYPRHADFTFCFSKINCSIPWAYKLHLLKFYSSYSVRPGALCGITDPFLEKLIVLLLVKEFSAFVVSINSISRLQELDVTSMHNSTQTEPLYTHNHYSFRYILILYATYSSVFQFEDSDPLIIPVNQKWWTTDLSLSVYIIS